MNKRYLYFLLTIVFLLACNIGSPTPPPSRPDLFATLQASTPATDFTPGALITSVPVGVTSTPLSNPGPTNPPPSNNGNSGSTPFASAADGLTGHIVYTCQIFKVQAMNQICIINADGSGMRRLTTEDNLQHVYAALSPDGSSVLYAEFREANVYEIYEMNLANGNVKQLTNKLGVLKAPEVSPDGSKIVFGRWAPNNDQEQVWLMNRDGSDPNNIPKLIGWDPTWSPDGKQILFATTNDNGSNQLFITTTEGKNRHQISNLPSIRGRSDWSPNGQYIVTYSGEAWHREIFLMNADGSDAHQISPAGGNAQGPSFSPDGQWIVFTAYYDHYKDDHGCELYIMRLDGSNLRRLTDNDYCDYQPRWGP